jgi:hypothetical protein
MRLNNQPLSLIHYLIGVSALFYTVMSVACARDISPRRNPVSYVPVDTRLQEDLTRQQKEEKARQYEYEFAHGQAEATGFEPNIGKVARLANRDFSENRQQVSTDPVLVSGERSPLLVLQRYHNLLDSQRGLGDNGFNDGFQAADLKMALVATKAAVDQHIAAKELFEFPYGTRVRIVEFRPPGYVPPPDGPPKSESGRGLRSSCVPPSTSAPIWSKFWKEKRKEERFGRTPREKTNRFAATLSSCVFPSKLLSQFRSL